MSEPPPVPYRVLARKYRPQHFDELRGQDALVRTLKNAISSGRIAQAYMLTGVRGVGKTTTARIIARAINYVGPDGTSGPTTGPTDDCPIAQAIAQDRCPDVLELDAASRTGVDDMREIIDGVRYAPTMARYKVYIIDEVHMLSKAAFNALLKTLEEPPPHVKFIFATTEIRKVPMTILSRCQRFDLRRLEEDEIKKHLADICAREELTADDAALKMIARAAGGSVRDSMSMLDQAIALSGTHIKADIVTDMLGLMDQGKVADVLAHALSGGIPAALAGVADLNRCGADMSVMIEDLLSLVHILMKGRVGGSALMDGLLTHEKLLSQTLPSLSRAWQILLKSYQDIQVAPDPLAAAEMAIIRLGYASTLPDPSRLMRTLEDNGGVSGGGAGGGAGQGNTHSSAPTATARRMASPVSDVSVQSQTHVSADALSSAQAITSYLEEQGQMILASSVSHYMAPLRIEAGRIECVMLQGAPPKLAGDLGAALSQLTGMRWVVTLGHGTPGLTGAQEQAKAREVEHHRILQTPVVQAVLLAFPGAQLEENE